MIETSISDFHKSFYIPPIQKLMYHMPHICILGKFHCVNTCSEEFKGCIFFQMCCVLLIILREWQLVLHIKFNLNTTATIDMCLLKELHCITLVQPHSHEQYQYYNHSHTMIQFTTNCIFKANKILPQQLHTAKNHGIVEATKKYGFKVDYNM